MYRLVEDYNKYLNLGSKALFSDVNKGGFLESTFGGNNPRKDIES